MGGWAGGGGGHILVAVPVRLYELMCLLMDPSSNAWVSLSVLHFRLSLIQLPKSIMQSFNLDVLTYPGPGEQGYGAGYKAQKVRQQRRGGVLCSAHTEVRPC